MKNLYLPFLLVLLLQSEAFAQPFQLNYRICNECPANGEVQQNINYTYGNQTPYEINHIESDYDMRLVVTPPNAQPPTRFHQGIDYLPSERPIIHSMNGKKAV